jgi:hypothetical protein
MKFDMAPEVLALISEKLTEVAARDLGYEILFEWPHAGDLSQLVMVPDHKLTPAERQRLEDWSKDKLGATWKARTIWERLEDD